MSLMHASFMFAQTRCFLRKYRCCAWIVSLLLGAGCSNFNHAWRAADGQSTGTVLPSLTGKWIGTWRSDVNGHTDQLRCIIVGDGHKTVSARFHARYKKALLKLSFGYTVPLTIGTNDERIEFSGEADLGWYAGGVYRCEGFATGTNFFSTYRSRYDHGTFRLHRPGSSSE